MKQQGAHHPFLFPPSPRCADICTPITGREGREGKKIRRSFSFDAGLRGVGRNHKVEVAAAVTPTITFSESGAEVSPGSFVQIGR